MIYSALVLIDHQPETGCAREICNMLMMPGAHEVFDLFEGRVMVAGCNVTAKPTTYTR